MDSVEAVATGGLELVHHRVQVSKMLESRAKDMKPERIEVASKAGFTFRAMQPPLHIPLMNWASDLAMLKTAHSPIIYYLKCVVLNY